MFVEGAAFAELGEGNVHDGARGEQRREVAQVAPRRTQKVRAKY